MKTLILNSRVADDISKGVKTTVLQINDNQHISVDDELELIEKVGQGEFAIWHRIGIAKVDKLIEKRLADLDANELNDLGTFASQAEMLKAARAYAGSDVYFDTHAKIVQFKITTDSKLTDEAVNITSNIKEIKLFADGGSRGNPGPSACGFVIMDMTGKVVVKKGLYLGVTTNNQAEYQALKLGLEEALHIQARRVHVFMDSMLVVNQMLGIFKVKNRDLWPIHVEITDIVLKFNKVSFTQIPRELNKLADRAVNEALNEAARRQ